MLVRLRHTILVVISFLFLFSNLSVAQIDIQAPAHAGINDLHEVIISTGATQPGGLALRETTQSPFNPWLDYQVVGECYEPTADRSGEPTKRIRAFYFGNGVNSGNGPSGIGDHWKFFIRPDVPGTWYCRLSAVHGDLANIDLIRPVGSGVTSLDVDGDDFEFDVGPKRTFWKHDFRKHGRLKPFGNYFKSSSTNKVWLEAGLNSPETLMESKAFDDCEGCLTYSSHIDHWESGDPIWTSNVGDTPTSNHSKGMIGALNYISGRHNAAIRADGVYWIDMNLVGDGNRTHPFVSTSCVDGDSGHGANCCKDVETRNYDVRRLWQRAKVVEHMNNVGLTIRPMLAEQEQENLECLDDDDAAYPGEFGITRRLYFSNVVSQYSELHLGIPIWGLMEEQSVNDYDQDGNYNEYPDDLPSSLYAGWEFRAHSLHEMSYTIAALDPNKNQVTVHTDNDHILIYNEQAEQPESSLPGYEYGFKTAALQAGFSRRGDSEQDGNDNVYAKVRAMHNLFTSLGIEGRVAMEEPWSGQAMKANGQNRAETRHVIWEALLGGAYASNVYMGGGRDINTTNFALYETNLRDLRAAKKIVTNNVTFWELNRGCGPRLFGAESYPEWGDVLCMVKVSGAISEMLAFYPKANRELGTILFPGSSDGTVVIRWYDPKNGALMGVQVESGTARVRLQPPNGDLSQDYVMIAKMRN